jgi:hypothetical protein
MRQYHGFDAAAIVALVQKWADGLNARRVKRAAFTAAMRKA